MSIKIGFLLTFDVKAICTYCNETFTQKVYPDPSGYVLHGTTCECEAGFLFSNSDREKLEAFKKEYFDFYGDDTEDEETDEEKEFNRKYDEYEKAKAEYIQAFISDGYHPVEAEMIADEMAFYLLK